MIAYSTMSQIGYMFLGAGIGAYGFAMFHLVTHAFFKALLFLAAGLVIHHLAGEQDIRRMGGLRALDALHACDVPDRLARARRDPDLRRASGRRTRSSPRRSHTAAALGWVLYVGGLLGALLTGLYTFRLYFRVFHGEPAAAEPHDGGAPRRGRRARCSFPSGCSRWARRSSASSRSRASGSPSRLARPGRRAARDPVRRRRSG